jgi:hypothetical protein
MHRENYMLDDTVASNRLSLRTRVLTRVHSMEGILVHLASPCACTVSLRAYAMRGFMLLILHRVKVIMK